MTDHIIAVECRFENNGDVTVRRIQRAGRWEPVEQGRQWRDANGRHILVMLNGRVHTLSLHPETLIWTLKPPDSAPRPL